MPIQRRRTVATLAATAFALAGCAGEATSASPQASPTPVATAAPSTTAPSPETGEAPASEPASWPDTVEEVDSGVIRISTTSCSEAGKAGSGFLVDDDLIVTNAHVVENASHLTVGSTAVPAEIVGYSEEADLALLHVSEPMDGHVFSWVDENPRVGDEVAALGYPLGGVFSSTHGVVSSLDPTGGILRDTVEYIQTDAPVNFGNSGGPLLVQDGDVAGVVVAKLGSGDEAIEGIGYAVSVTDAQRLVENWAESPQPQPLEECQVDPTVPDPVDSSEVAVEVTTTHENAEAIAQSLALHGNSINTKTYNVAFNLLTPAMQDKMGGLQTWQEGVYTSSWQAVGLEEVSGTGGELHAQVWLVTEQQPEYGPDGQTCSIWPIDYTMVLEKDTGIWLIDQAELRSEPENCG